MKDEKINQIRSALSGILKGQDVMIFYRNKNGIIDMYSQNTNWNFAAEVATLSQSIAINIVNNEMKIKRHKDKMI